MNESGVKATISLLVYAGSAKPTPKLGQALGPLGVNMMYFCKDFNAATKDIRPDVPMRVRLWAFMDRTFYFQLKPPPTSWMLKKAAGLHKCSSVANVTLANVSIKQIYEIAKIKRDIDPDHKNVPLEAICSMIMGQCRSLGIDVVEDMYQDKFVYIKTKAIR